MVDATMLRADAAMLVNDGVPIAACATAADLYRRKVCSPENLPASKDIWSPEPHRLLRTVEL